MTGLTRFKKYVFTCFLVFFLLSINIFECAAENMRFFELLNIDEKTDGYYEMVNEKDGQIIMKTARVMHVGDIYVDGNNRLFRVVDIQNEKATARFLRNIEPTTSESNGFQQVIEIPVQVGKQCLIAIYHTHGAESYVPSDGTDSIPKGGGILSVGKNLEAALQKYGIETLRSEELHVPHDAGAYHRSRRTVEDFSSKSPTAYFDVHRDAVPSAEYLEAVEGTERVQIMLVVGRQNQNAGNNREFAEGLKRIADKTHPGLIKGIFMARGNYNQDMSPRAILLEVGSHENQREGAEESIGLFADVINAYFKNGKKEELRETAPNILNGGGKTALRNALWIFGLLLATVFGYLLVSTGSWQEMKNKIRHFFGKEFAELERKDPKQDKEDGGNS